MIETTDKLAMLHFRQRLAAALEVLASGRVHEARVMLEKLLAEGEARVKGQET
jgi:hypothetical protein